MRPGDGSYRDDVRLYDFRYDSVRPAGIAYCATSDDVARCVAFARDHGLTPTPRAGGHSYAGYSLSPGLVVDVTPMAGVTPTPARGRAAIGAGARLVDVYSGLNAAGVSVPAGSCPTVGLSGLALGGGIGVVCRAHGLTSDSVLSATVVTADSRTVTASATSNPDLYWALRGGGGGNFGVVTSWEMATFPTTAAVLSFLTWPWAAAGEVLAAWQAWTAAAPDRLWSNLVMQALPSRSEPSLQVGVVDLGTTADSAALVGRLTAAAGPPATSSSADVPFAHAMFVEAGCAALSEDQCHLPSQAPGGTLARAPSVAKSALLVDPLDVAGVSVVVDAVAARQHAGVEGAAGFDALGGATSRPAPDATAWVHRDARWSLQYSVPVTEGAPPSALAGDHAWLATLAADLAPHVGGQAYQNYIDPSLADWEQAYYGANLGRLAAARRRWDPDATFRFSQAVPLRPASG